MSIKTAQFLETAYHSFSTVVITGACRSGKTLLGNILATFKEVEYADEPYAPMMLPMIVQAGKIDREFSIRWMRALINELFNDLLLLRQANFRPSDLSTIWKKKSVDEIFNRLLNIQSRAEASQLSKQNKSILLMTLAECTLFNEFLFQAIPGVKIIHVVRHPYQVAQDVVKKKWFSDEQLINPANAQLYNRVLYKNQSWHLPWWVASEESEYFIHLTEFERGIYYWCALMDNIQTQQDCATIIVRYEDLTTRPRQVINYLADFLNLTKSSLTEIELHKITPVEINELYEPINCIIQNRVNLIKDYLNDSKHCQYQ